MRATALTVRDEMTGLDDLQQPGGPIGGLLLPAGNAAVTTHYAAREEIWHFVTARGLFCIHEAGAVSGTVVAALETSASGQSSDDPRCVPNLVERLAPSAGYRFDRAFARLHRHGSTRRRISSRRFGIAQSRESGCRAPHDRFRNPGSTPRTSAMATTRSPAALIQSSASAPLREYAAATVLATIRLTAALTVERERHSACSAAHWPVALGAVATPGLRDAASSPRC